MIIWIISFLPLLFLGFIMNSIGRQFENIIWFWLLSFSLVVAIKLPGIKKFCAASLMLIFLPKTDLFPQKYGNFNINFNINNIAKELIYNDLNAYETEINDRVNLLKTTRSDSVIVDRIKTVPIVLYFDEMSSVKEDRDYVSMQLEKYFNKKYIRTK